MNQRQIAHVCHRQSLSRRKLPPKTLAQKHDFKNFQQKRHILRSSPNLNKIIAYSHNGINDSSAKQEFFRWSYKFGGAVTQSFNTSSSMGRLTLNVLLSFAQFEREVTAVLSDE